MILPNPLHSLLHETSKELVRHRHLADLLPDILRRAQEFVDADLAYMALRDETSDVMRVAYYRGTIRELPEKYFIRQGQGVSGQAWASGKVVVAEDYLHYGQRLPEPYWDSMRATMGVPLFVDGMVWGTLILAHTAGTQTYTEWEIEGVEQLANFASLAIENAQMLEKATAEIKRREATEAALKRKTIRYRTVLAESATAMCSVDPESLGILEANRSFLRMFGYSMREILSLKLYDLVAYDRESVDRTCKEELPLQRALPPFAITALRKGGEPIEIEFRLQLIRLVNQSIIFLSGRDLSEQRENHFLKVLQETSVDILQRKDRGELLRTILQRSMELISAPHGALWLVSEDGERIEPQLTIGHKAPPPWTFARRGEGLAGIVWETGQSLSIAHYQEWPNRLPVPAEETARAAEPAHAVVGCPLTNSGGQVIGVLELADISPFREFDLQECHYFGQMAHMAALAIENATLLAAAQSEVRKRGEAEQQIRQAYDSLDRTYENTLIGWARALDMRDGETQDHSRRVADITLKLAKLVGMPESEWVHVWRGALLHDIGKVGIPDAILLKQGPLEEAEWTVMRQHPLYGVGWVERVDHLKPVIPLIKHHHEHWDGSGYPDGLKENEIPLPARIFSIVDVWDALLSRRPYREAWTIQQTIAFLRENAGRQFDPQLTEIFLQHYQELT